MGIKEMNYTVYLNYNIYDLPSNSKNEVFFKGLKHYKAIEKLRYLDENKPVKSPMGYQIMDEKSFSKINSNKQLKMNI